MMNKDNEVCAKRKNSSNNNGGGQEDYKIRKRTNSFADDWLSLTIGSFSEPELLSPTSHQQQNPAETGESLQTTTIATTQNWPYPGWWPSSPPSHPPRQPNPRRKNSTTPPAPVAPPEGKSIYIPIPFPWATYYRATVHSMEYLLSKKIETISGKVLCKKCDREYELGFDLKEKFVEVGEFIVQNKDSMHDRAPSVWMSPIFPNCKYCNQENSVKPVMSPKKKAINWLFLLLGQMLGCCTLDQLKYFCKYSNNHRTGAKDRVLYLTYLGLCKQLIPDGPFDR